MAENEGKARRIGRPNAAILSRDIIASAGLAIVDTTGNDGFSMHQLARELGVMVSSLYNHVSSKEDVIDAIREIVSDRISTDCFVTMEWAEAVRHWAIDYLHAFVAHPPTIAILATRALDTAHRTFSMYERVAIGFERAGWPEARAQEVMVAFESFILGSALDACAPPTMFALGEASKVYPTFHRQFEARRSSRGESGIAAGAFYAGLDALIVGFSVELDQYRRAR